MCGFVGLIGVERASAALSMGLQAIQHRGQDACGIGTAHQGRFQVHKELGQVAAVFTNDIVAQLHGVAGIGHTRYPTVGAGVRADAQPFYTPRPGVLMAHNGNVTNLDDAVSVESSVVGPAVDRLESRVVETVVMLLLLRARWRRSTRGTSPRAIRRRRLTVR